MVKKMDPRLRASAFWPVFSAASSSLWTIFPVIHKSLLFFGLQSSTIISSIRSQKRPKKRPAPHSDYHHGDDAEYKDFFDTDHPPESYGFPEHDHEYDPPHVDEYGPHAHGGGGGDGYGPPPHFKV